jgi:hypothetical protein
MHLLDEVAQHRFGGVEIGDDAIFEWPDGQDVAGCAPEHLLGFDTYRQDLLEVAVNRHHRWLAQDDTAPLDVD